MASYFIKFIFSNKTRQRLLLLAMAGLFLSTLSLLLLQNIMGGLQESQIKRSRQIEGVAELRLKELEPIRAGRGLWTLEYEALAQVGSRIMPIRLIGVDWESEIPEFLGEKTRDLVIGEELAWNLGLRKGSSLRIVLPSETVAFLGDIPRFSDARVEKLIQTNHGESDHYWVLLGRLLLKTWHAKMGTIRFVIMTKSHRNPCYQRQTCKVGGSSPNAIILFKT